MAISLIKEFKQKQKVSLTPQLKKSIDLLQLSRYELIQKIDNEIESNPFIEKEDFDDFEFKANPDDFDFEISASESLRQNLINQIEDLGLDENSRRIALLIIDSIDESGQLHDSLDELEAMMDFQFNFYDIEVVLKNNGGSGFSIQWEMNNEDIAKVERIENISPTNQQAGSAVGLPLLLRTLGFQWSNEICKLEK